MVIGVEVFAVMEKRLGEFNLEIVSDDLGFQDSRRFQLPKALYGRDRMRSQNKPVDPVISEICKRNSIVAYLNSKGIELRKQGKRQVCKCPIPGHIDDTPSFCVWTTPDGTELWHCFGRCNKTGNIISLMRLMEKEPKGVIRRLADKSGVSLKGFDEKAVRIDPLPSEIAEFLCQDDQLAIEMATWTIAFMRARGTVDAIEKESRLYEKIDRLSEVGDEDGLQKVCVDLQRTLGKYR